MRLFIAIDLDNNAYFSKIQDQIPSAIATIPKEFHLTLKFLGETEKQEEIIEKLGKIRFKAFKLNATKIGVFPSEEFIQVVWVGLDDNIALFELQKEVEEALKDFGFKKDYDFVPHITLARIKYIKSDQKKEFVKKIKEIKIENKSFEVNEFKLIKSELTPDGPVYTLVKVFKA